VDKKRVDLQFRLQELADAFPMRQRKAFRSYAAQLSILEEMLEEINDGLAVESVMNLTGALDHLKPNVEKTHPEMLSQAYRKLFKLQSDVQARWVTNYPRTKDLLNLLYEEYWKRNGGGYASFDSGFGIEDFAERAEELAEDIALEPAAVELFIADFLTFLEFNGVASMRSVFDELEATMIQEQAGLL